MARSGRSFVGYQRTHYRRLRSLGLAASAAVIGVRGIEVSQCIQDLDNSVPLIADKTTVVRLYLDPATLGKAGSVTAELAWSRGGAEAYLPALNAVRLDPAKNEDIHAQRSDLEKSVNFRLPAEAIGAGTLRLRLSRVFAPGGSDLPVGAPNTVDVDFVSAPPLRIRVIGLRYRAGGKPVAPDAIHFNYFRSYLGRAYPVASLEWSQIVVDADFGSPFNASTVDLANAQIAAVRGHEVANGVDRRTHYFGLVDDNGGLSGYFMRGKAYAIPSSKPQPDTVASGPCGTPRGLAGDRDLSYADWYGAHELGHTFGRYHPGFPPYDPATKAGQDASDPAFPYAGGFISTPDGRYVGLDTGDPDLPAPMMALPGLGYHDVMTYADNQWLSAYTYMAILERLIAEDALGPAIS